VAGSFRCPSQEVDPIGSTYVTSEQGKLPILVGILAVLIGIIGFVVLLGGLIILLIYFGVLVGNAYNFYGGAGLVIGAFIFLFGLIMLVVARDLWDCEMWALVTLGIVVVIELIESVLTVHYIWAAVWIFLLVYLVAVREHFS
jgi:hypothetical protein